MTAACAAIWLAVNAALCPTVAELLLCAPTCDKLEVAVDGSVGSNMPCVAVCFLDSFLTNGDEEPCVTALGDPVGLEKL